MFFKHEKHEMHDFERKKTLIVQEKYCENKFLMDTLAKI